MSNGLLMTYRYVSDQAVVIFSVAGEADWTEEMYDSVAEDQLRELVIEPDAFYVDDQF